LPELIRITTALELGASKENEGCHLIIAEIASQLVLRGLFNHHKTLQRQLRKRMILRVRRREALVNLM
jgi:hypothetical protein